MADLEAVGKIMIREYRTSDWSEICRVFDLSKPWELATGGADASFIPLAEDHQRIAAFAKSTVFVWVENGRLKGFVGYDKSHINWLFVEPAAFRTGIGRSLLRHVLPRIEGDAWLWSMKGNRAALSLYRSEGFEIMEERHTHNRGSPCVALKLVQKRSVPNQVAEPTRTAVTPPAEHKDTPAGARGSP